jgi:type IV pilus assembly protein PilW
MKVRMSPLGIKREQGFTLIELMVAVAAFSIVSLAAFAVLDSGQRNALMNDQTVKVQQNVRLAMDLIARDIRMTGYGNPAAGSLPPCANHMNALDNAPGADGGPDSISIMTLNQQVGTLFANALPGAAFLTLNVAGLVAPVAPGLVTLEGVFITTGTPGAPGILNLLQTLPPTASFPINTRVFDLACVTYTVTLAGATPPFQLMRQVGNLPAVPIVDGIESLQLAYALDVAPLDGAIDDQAGGVAGVFDCLDFVPNNGPCTDVVARPAGTGTVTAIPAAMNQTPSPVRQVRVTIVGRAIPPANMYLPNNCWRDSTFTGSAVITAEDQVLTQATASVPVACGLPQGGIRRRSLTRVVSLRETTSQ